MILEFEMKGKMAHWSSNNSNVMEISVPVPPRSSILGMISAIMGLKYNEGLEVFNDDSCKVGVIVGSKSHIKITTVNHLNTSDFLESRKIETYQKKIGILLPVDKALLYKVFLQHNDEKIIKKIYQIILGREYIYPPVMGSAFCPAILDRPVIHENYFSIQEVESVCSVCPEDYVKKIEGHYYMTGNMRRIVNEKRITIQLKNYVYTISPNVLKGRFKGDFVCVGGRVISWL